MELLLQVEDGRERTWQARESPSASLPSPVKNVCVDAEDNHTVHQLTIALCAHVDRRARHVDKRPTSRLCRVAPRSRSGATRPFRAEPLDPASRLCDTGIRSGERLILTAGRGAHRPRGERPDLVDAEPSPRLVVASGPDAGRGANVGAGLVVGRDWTCGLRLRDPNVGRRAIRVEAVPESPPGPAATSRDAGASPPVVVVRPLPGSSVSVNGRKVNPPAGRNPGEEPSDGVGVTETDLVRVGSSTLRVEPAPSEGHGEPIEPGSTLQGNSPTLGAVLVDRVSIAAPPLEPVVFPPLGDLPERPDPPRFGLLVALAPVLLGITLAVFYSPRMLLFAAFAPVMAGAAYLEARRRNRARFAAGTAEVRERLDERRAELQDATQAERRARFALAPDLATLAAGFAADPPRVWPRRLDQSDELVVRAGLGSVDSVVEVQPEPRGDRALRSEVEGVVAGFRSIEDVPVTVNLAAGVVAVAGERGDAAEVVASMVAQATCLHPPHDLVVTAALDAVSPLAGWVAWLPHARATSSPLSGRAVAVGDPVGSAWRVLLAELVAVADDRVANERARGADGPRLLVVLDGYREADQGLVSALLNAAPAARISVILMTASGDPVPWQTSLTIHCQPVVSGELSVMTNGAQPRSEQRFEADRLSMEEAERIARQLAPCLDQAEVDRGGSVPPIASLADVLQTERIDERWVQNRWNTADQHRLVVPIGLTGSGPIEVDLVEHGPHGLIGGTSGSGKSELLISLVAALIARYPPTRVSVLFIDYKGGSSSEPFTTAPHTVGCVTNLDPFLARRALLSLRAELDRRMGLLAGRARDLAELRVRCPADAPPALLIIVDELAALVNDVPEFVAGLVDIAQRGRSLGIHLLLATQRPAGVVNDQILANTNLRIALRMLDGTDSTGLLGTRDAATIPTEAKGQAFARLGPTSPVRFQSAWSGAPTGRQDTLGPIVVRPLLHRAGSPSAGSPSATQHSAEPNTGPTQLDDLLAAVAAAAVNQPADGALRRPWHDELPTKVPLARLRDTAGTSAPRPRAQGAVVVGLLDEPQRQRQEPAVVDLAAGGLAIFGSGGSGKSAALRTLASSAALDFDLHATDDLLIFGLDFGSQDLAPVARLPACVEIASGDDLEAVTRIVAILHDTLQDRRNAKLDPGARSPRHKPATVLLLIDDYGNLAATFEGAGASATLHPWFETLNKVITDGRQLGVWTALTATRRAIVRAGVLAAVTNRVVLRQSESGSLVEHGLPSSLHEAELPPGRGFLSDSIQIQFAVGDPIADQPVDPAGLADRHPRLTRRSLPTQLDLSENTSPAPEPGSVVLGVADLADSDDMVAVDLTVGDLVVVGDPRSGRTTAACTVAAQLVSAGAEVWAIGGVRSALESLPALHRRAFGDDGRVLDLLENLARRPSPAGTSKSVYPGPVLVVDDLDLLDRPELERPFAAIAESGIRCVVAASPFRVYSTNAFVQRMRRARSLLFLRPDGSREIHELTGVAPAIRPGIGMPPGRGILVVNRRATVIQVACLASGRTPG